MPHDTLPICNPLPSLAFDLYHSMRLIPPFFLQSRQCHGTNMRAAENQEGMDKHCMNCGVRVGIIISIALLLVFLQPAYANGDHIHVGGIFLVLLGGVVFVGSLVVVFYLLLRSNADEANEEQDLGE